MLPERMPPNPVLVRVSNTILNSESSTVLSTVSKTASKTVPNAIASTASSTASSTVLKTVSVSQPELDLTAIWGIGITKKQWLASIEIHTVSDLAGAVVEEIQVKLRQKGYGVAGREILGWIVQAQELMAIAELPSSDTLSPHPPNPNHSGELATAIDTVDLPCVPAEPPIWESMAGFQVRFQTSRSSGTLKKRTIVYDLNHKMVRTWQDWDSVSIQEWIDTRLQECIEEYQAEWQRFELATTIDEETYKPSIAVEVTHLRLLRSNWYQRPLVADQDYRAFPDKIQAGEPFNLEASIEFHGIETAQLQATQLVYQAQCYARHLATGATILLDEITVNVPASPVALYSVLFSEVVLDQPGAYRLTVSVAVENAVSIAGQFRIPLLQVV